MSQKGPVHTSVAVQCDVITAANIDYTVPTIDIGSFRNDAPTDY